MSVKRIIQTDVLLSVATGKLLCKDISDYHEAIEFILGHPVFSHHFASSKLHSKLSEVLLKQHPDLTPDLADDVNPSNVWEKRDALIKRFGETREIIGGNNEPELDLFEGIPDDKQVIVVEKTDNL